MKHKSFPFFLILTAATMLLLLSAAIAVPILLRPFYYAHAAFLHLPEQTGWSMVQIHEAYNEMLDMLPDRELICGFLSGKAELLSWEPSDLFQFYYDTQPLQGSLDELLPLLNKDVVERAIKAGACNIYHGCVHNMLYEKDTEILKSLYKAAVFVIQASCYKNEGIYVKRHSDLAEYVDGREMKIVRTASELRQGMKVQFREMSEKLFEWAKCQIVNTASGSTSSARSFEKMERNIEDVVRVSGLEG